MLQVLVASAIVLGATVLPSMAQTFTVNTPASCLQCTACLLNWAESPAHPVFTLSIIPAEQTSAPPLIPAVQTNDTQITFLAPFGVNTQFTIQVTDATGQRQFSSPVNVVSGPTSSCVNDPNFNAFPSVPGYTVGNGTSGSSSSSSGSSSGSSSPSSSGSGSSPSPSSTGPTTAGSSSSSGGGTSTSTTSSPSGSPSKSSATALTSSYFALFGALLVALFA